MTDIAIIGGGAAGAAVFGELLQCGHPIVPHWITGSSGDGRGVAYATRDDRHLLNVRASGMGLFADRPDDFARHLRTARGEDFLPRRLFGEFVQSQVRARIETARQEGRAFSLDRHDAVAIVPNATTGYRVTLADGRSRDVHAVVLAIGALPSRPLPAVSADAIASGAYVLEPWRLPHPLRQPGRVVVIGTGLTAVDTLLSASSRWPRAELMAISRHGLLPFAHSPQPLPAYPAQADLNDMLLACDGSAAMLRKIRRICAQAAATDWRSIVDGMRSINSTLWQHLTHTQRQQFLRHVRWVWEAARHRMAPDSAAAIQRLQNDGRLDVRAARILAVQGGGPLELVLRQRAGQRPALIEADLVIQATGLDTDVARTSHVLLDQLLRSGLAIPDALRLGIAADDDGCLIDATGRPQPGLHVIGSLLRGQRWECTAMPEIRVAARALADVLAAYDHHHPPILDYPPADTSCPQDPVAC